MIGSSPKLMNDLRRPTMEEIGNRSAKFSFNGIAGNRRECIDWLLKACTVVDVDLADTIEPATVELLAKKLRTQLQIDH